MKEKNFRHKESSEDYLKRPAKLEPIRKSGKERHTLYDDDLDDESLDLGSYHHESAYDYFDDNVEEERI